LAAHNLETLRRERVARRNGSQKPFFSILLERLESSEREILMLREYEQLSYSEIAELLRIPVNTVRSRLFRSRMALKSYLEPASTVREEARHEEE
jgi:RNA polymerase sigma factor (sigma-70 family)